MVKLARPARSTQEAEVTSSWLSKEVQKAFSLRALHCLPGGVSIFPEVPAMEVAYEAFKRRIDKNNTQLSEDLTEEKVFFITACLSTCARTPSDNLFRRRLQQGRHELCTVCRGLQLSRGFRR
ncbi:hypothetical protein MRX96_001766 [Rhipicephalus microplus]